MMAGQATQGGQPLVDCRGAGLFDGRQMDAPFTGFFGG
jgi:hypothetical protein